MEAFDISNISGFESVGSMVVYEKGRPKRSDYRKFRIKSVQGPNDYASMEEVLTRRFTHESNAMNTTAFPKCRICFLMDGGPGTGKHSTGGSWTNWGLQTSCLWHGQRMTTTGREDCTYNNIEIPIETNSEGFRLITEDFSG